MFSAVSVTLTEIGSIVIDDVEENDTIVMGIGALMLLVVVGLILLTIGVMLDMSRLLTGGAILFVFGLATISQIRDEDTDT